MSYNLTETSIQFKYLHFKLIEKRNSCAHYRCFAVWCRGKETNIIASRTDFIDELFATKVLADAVYAEKQKNRH